MVAYHPRVGRSASTSVPTVEVLAQEALRTRIDYEGDSLPAAVFGLLSRYDVDWVTCYDRVLRAAQALADKARSMGTSQTLWESDSRPTPAPKAQSHRKHQEGYLGSHHAAAAMARLEESAPVIEMPNNQPLGQTNLPGFNS